MIKSDKKSICFIEHFYQHLNSWYDKKTIILGLVLPSFIINILALAFPLTLLQIYDRIIPNQSLHTLLILILIVIFSVSLEAFLKVVRSLIVSWSDARFDYETNKRLFKKILHCDLAQFETNGVGEHLEQLRSVSELKNFYGNQILTNLLDLIFVSIFLILIYYIGGILAIIPILTLSILIFLVFQSSASLEEGINSKQSCNTRRMNFLVEIFKSIHTVKSLALEPFMLRRYERLQDQTSEANYELGFINTSLQNNTTLLSQFTVILIVTLGSILVIHNHLTIGGLAACTLLASRSLQPIARSVGIWHKLSAIKQTEKALQELETLKPTTVVTPLITKGQINGAFQLIDINMSIEGKSLFHELSIEIQPNETLAITGNNLSGKSTLLAIFAGLIRPNSGQILLDGHPIEIYDPELLAKNIAYLPQQHVIFSGNVLDNITMFQPKYNKKALFISEQLGFDKIINRLPYGFDTQLGDTTTELLPSGINQLITIARGLLHDPKVILFDEANTSLDLESDHKLQQLFANYKGKKTIIMITHRPSFIKLADQKVEIKNQKLEWITDHE